MNTFTIPEQKSIERAALRVWEEERRPIPPAYLGEAWAWVVERVRCLLFDGYLPVPFNDADLVEEARRAAREIEGYHLWVAHGRRFTEPATIDVQERVDQDVEEDIKAAL